MLVFVVSHTLQVHLNIRLLLINQQLTYTKQLMSLLHGARVKQTNEALEYFLVCLNETVHFRR